MSDVWKNREADDLNGMLERLIAEKRRLRKFIETIAEHNHANLDDTRTAAQEVLKIDLSIPLQDKTP